MSTWRERFNQLSAAQQQALDDVTKARSTRERSAATNKVRATQRQVAEFLDKYESLGFPDHAEAMPDS